MSNVKLGDSVKDKLSVFEGTVVARAEYLYGCVWICVVPKKLQDNKPIEDVWFDEDRLEIKTQKPAIKKKSDQERLVYRRHGGPPMGMPKGPSHPKPQRG